ncbi:MAG: beta strand repeat-containing protein, partial [Caulobacteraceae bacterium]
MTQTHWLERSAGGFGDTPDWSAGIVRGPADETVLGAAAAATCTFAAVDFKTPGGPVGAAQTASGGFSLNVATGQNASGAIQTAGDLPDAHWTVSHADNYKNGPIAYTTAPGNADWYGASLGSDPWFANGPNSSWIAADPETAANGAMTFTLKFDLAGYNPADATLSGGQTAIDDVGTVSLNGHSLGSTPYPGWLSFSALSNGAGDFVAGVNTLVIQITSSDNNLEAARLEGTVVDTTPLSGFSLNLATGQNASGAIQTAGDLPDAHWTVSHADNYKNAPIAYTVAPGEADWSPYWLANGPGSSWIAADPNAGDNGDMTFTYNFDLTGYNPADATLAGGQFAADDNGAVYLNGHEIGADTSRNWEVLHPLSNGAGDFVAGMNTLVIQITNADNIDEAARLEGLVVDTVMTSTPIRWAKAVNGNFATASNWTGGVAPGAANDAIFEPSGAAFTVTAGASQSVNSIQTAADATLDITGGTFTAALGTGGGSNGGAIVVGDGAALALGGTVANIGSIGLDSGGAVTRLIVGGSSANLIGGGALTLSDNLNNRILASAAGATLRNIDNTIAGAGEIGGGGLVLRLSNGAAGIIDATGAVALVIATGSSPVENAGLIEGAGAGGLIVRNTAIDSSSGGVILAGNGSHVALQGADLIGGTLESTGSGQILVRTYTAGNQLDGRASAITNQARLILYDGTALTLQGAIANAGEIGIQGAGADTRVVVGAAGATLSGGGLILLGNEADNIITGSSGAATLTNVDNSLNGAGQLGLGSLTLINEADGEIVG